MQLDFFVLVTILVVVVIWNIYALNCQNYNLKLVL